MKRRKKGEKRMANTEEEKNKLGLLPCICILLGGCVGSAIFSISGLTIYYASASAVLSWVIAAFILGLYGLMTAELAVLCPTSGGVFMFPYKMLGKRWGFICAWGYIVSNCIAVAFSAIYVGVYLSASFPIFSPYRVPIAIFCIAVVTFLNLLEIKNMGRVNDIWVLFLVLAIATYVALSFSSENFSFASFSSFFDGAKGKTGWLQAVPNAMVGYGAVVSIAFMAGEVKKPQKTIPLSLVISLSLVVIIYLSLIVATLGHITTKFLQDNANFRFIPMYAAVFTSMKDKAWLGKLITFCAVMALLTTMLVVQAINAKALFCIAREKLLPVFFSKQTKKGECATSTITLAIIACILSCFPSSTEILVNLGSLLGAVTIVIVCLSLISARKKMPFIEGSFHVVGGNFLVVATICLILVSYIPSIFNGGTMMWAWTFLVYFVGIIIMEAFIRKSKHHAFQEKE